MKRRARRRRRLLLAGGAGVVAVVAIVLGVSGVFRPRDQGADPARSATRTSSASRRQDKDVDASLIAAVIYAESRFRDQTSRAGARGLMQITPTTAKEIERLSGGTTFKLERPLRSRNQHPLRDLLPGLPPRTDSTAARSRRSPPTTRGRPRSTNGGAARSTLDEIPIDETRDYVEEVLDKRQDYRREYAQELGY